jgi:hypothetical protein
MWWKLLLTLSSATLILTACATSNDQSVTTERGVKTEVTQPKQFAPQLDQNTLAGMAENQLIQLNPRYGREINTLIPSENLGAPITN